MRILGGKDYYDNGMGLSYDKSDPVVLVRDKNPENYIVVEDKNLDPVFKEFAQQTNSIIIPSSGLFDFTCSGFRINDKFEFSFKTVVVYFCGKIYNGLRIDVADNSPFNGLKPFKVVWSMDEFTGFIEKHIDEPIEDWKYISNSYYFRDKFREVKDTAKLLRSIASFFVVKDTPVLFEEFVRENRISIVTLRPSYTKFGSGTDNNIFLNHDDLGILEFFKVFDPYQAFQELSMWVGNMNSPENNMVQLSDKELIAKHGFDKWSFRKMSS